MNPKNLNTDNIPTLRFPEFKGEWEKKKLGEVAVIGRGKSKHRPRDAEFLYGGKYPFIQTGDIRNAGLFLDTYTQTYSDEGLKQSKLWNENTLCVTIAANIAETTILKIKACFPDSVIGLVPQEKQSIVLFLKYQFDKFKIEVQKFSQGLAQANLNQESLSNIEFHFPTLPEQTKIAAFLTAVDEKIQALKKKKVGLENYKKGVMQRLFSSALGFVGLEDDRINEKKENDERNPKILQSNKSKFRQLRFKNANGNDFPDWEVKKLGEVGEVITGLTYSPNDISNDGVLVLRSSNVKNRQILLEDNVYVKTNSFNKVLENDILICVRNGSKNLIGKNALISKESEGLAFGAFMVIYRSKLNSFIFHLFDTEKYYKIINENLGATINSINNSDLKKFEFNFPSLPELTKIANFLSSIDDKINKTNTQITQTETWKKGLLQKMFV